MPGLFDHLLALLLLVAYPIYIATFGRNELDTWASSAERKRGYRSTLLSEWAITFVLIGIWVWYSRAWAELGLGVDIGFRPGFDGDLGFWLVAGFVVVLLSLLVHDLGRTRRDPRRLAKIRAASEDLVNMLPTNAGEARLFDALAVTAGICEELAYRGFLLWYLGAWFHPMAAIVIAGLAFGAVHLYQGPAHALRIAGLGVVTGALFLLGGSLWLLMILHAGVDLLQMRLVRSAHLDLVPAASGALLEPPGQPGA